MKNLVLMVALLVGSLAFSQHKTDKNLKAEPNYSFIQDSAECEKNFRKHLSRSGLVMFGIKAGYSHSNLYGKEIDYIFANNKTEWLPGFHAGLMVNASLNKFLGLKHELLFSMRGARVNLPDSIHGPYSSSLKTYYLDLYPVSPTFHFKGFQLYAGPYVSLLTAASIQRKNETGNLFNDRTIFGTPGNRESENENKYLQKFDFGIHAGIEYQFQFGLFIGAKYVRGFTDIFQYANSYTFDDPKVDNIRIFTQTLMISAGYCFLSKYK
ncbi:MAG: porin family protein [Chitinophagales bacterium]|nr:PorT family protein [Chitinophagales bacterium]MDW8273560.1 porin family protein [Chitinophagales bacterium]